MKTKQFIMNMFSTILAFIVNTGISFFLTPYITNNISGEAYGFVSLANNFVMYASLVTIALNSMAGRFITLKIHQNKIEEANKYFTSILIANIIFTIILIIPTAFIVFFLDEFLNISKELVFDVKILFLFIFINFFLSIINATYSTATFVRNRLDLSSKINIVSYLLRAGLVLVIFTVLEPKISYIGIISCFISIYVLAMNFRYTKKLLPEISVHKKYFDLRKILQIVKSGIWNTITKLGQILSDGLDLLITNIFITPEAMGQFAIVKTIVTCLTSFVSTFAGIFSPQQTIHYAEGNLEVVVNDFKFSMKLTSFMSNMMYAFLVVFGFSFYKLWVPNIDTNLLNTLSIASILSQLTLSSIVPLWQVFTITNKLKVNSLVTVGTGLLNVILVFILMKTTNLGVFAIVGVSSITAIIKNITYTPIYSAHCLGVNKKTFYPEILKNLFVTAILIIMNFILSKVVIVDSWKSLILAVLMSGTIGSMINYTLLFSRKERQKILNIVKKIVNKIPGLETIIWNCRVLLRNLYWYVYSFYKIDKNKIIIDNFNGNGYADNPKYIAEKLIARNPDLDIVCVLNKKYISKKEKLPLYIRTVEYGSREWIYEQCTAKIWIDNVRKTYFYKKRKDQFYIQTWHGGLSVKQIEKDVEDKLSTKYVKYAKKDSKHIDLLISDSRWQTNMYKRAFWYSGEILECGLPRNDILYDKLKKKQIIKKLDKYFSLNDKIIKVLYAPTFRKNLEASAYKLDFDAILKHTQKKYNKKAVILVKLHPNVIHLANDLNYNDFVINANGINDTQELEIYSDILITDYSSMMFEYLLMNKPCFIYVNDLEDYLKERNLCFDFTDLPFPVARDIKMLTKNIDLFSEKRYFNDIKEFKNKERPIENKYASRDVSIWIEQKIGENKNDSKKN